MKKLPGLICLSTALVLLSPPGPVNAASRATLGIWEIDYGCAPGMFGYVRNLDQLVEAIEQKSRMFPVNYSVKLDGDTVRVFDGRRMYVYRFVGDSGLRIIRYSQLDEPRSIRSRAATGRNCR